MKKLLVTITSALACVGAFGQGSVSFELDSNHLIYFTTDTARLHAADVAWAGFGAYVSGAGGDNPVNALSGSPTFVAALYGGANALSMTLQTTTALQDWGGEGQPLPASVYPAGIVGGTQWTWQVQVFANNNPAFGTAPALGAQVSWAAGTYAGVSDVFQATLNGAVAVPIWDPVNASSTWANGTFELVDYPGNFGAIPLSTVPEPGTFALAGLGLAALLVLRRRS